MKTYVELDEYGTIKSIITRPSAEQIAALSLPVPESYQEVSEEKLQGINLSVLTHYFDTAGNIQEYTDTQKIAITRSPGLGWEWRAQQGGWIDTRDNVTQIEAQWQLVRNKRNRLLQESDWTVLADSPLSESTKAEWITYRQALRDVTLQPDPFNITWPIAPGN